jgi:hypothetical protein
MAVGVLQLLVGDAAHADQLRSDGELAGFVRRLALAVEAALAAAAQRARVEWLERLTDAVAPSGALAVDRVLEFARSLPGAPRAGVWVRGRDELLALGGEAPGCAEATPVVSAMLDDAGGEPTAALVHPDLAADGRLAAAAAIARAGAAVVAPLRYDGRVIGALALLYDGRQVPADAIEAASRMSAPLALAVAAERGARAAVESAARARAAEESAASAERRTRAYDDVALALLAGADAEAALARAAAALARVDAAAVQLADAPFLRPAALHVSGGSLQEPVRLVLSKGLGVDAAPVARALAGETVMLAAEGDGPLEAFLRTGSSAALVPLGPPGAVRGVVVLVSLDPDRPVSADAADDVRRLSAR